MECAAMRFLLLLMPVLLAAADLAEDPALQRGVFANGLQWAVLPNHLPTGRASLRLRIASGSLLERDEQRGLAHYLEHLAFNGSERFPAGSLVETLQRLGLAFGADTNAHTSFGETVYKLDLPDVQAVTVALGLRVLADQGLGLTLAPQQVESERGVILAEMRDRDDAGRRSWQALASASYAGTVIADRMPIGTEATVRGATPELIADYYHAWYRPERMEVIAVGDIDPAAVVAQITAEFANRPAAAAAVTVPAPGELVPGAVVTWRHEPEATGTQVVIQQVRSEDPGPDSAGRRQRELQRDLAERVLVHRLERLIASDAQGPLQGVGAWSYHRWNLAHAGVEAQAKPGRVIDAAVLIDNERRRMLAHGPTVGELADEVAARRADLATAVAQATTRTSASLANLIAATADEGRACRAPVQDQALEEPWLATVTPADCRAAYIWAWAGPGRLVCVADGVEAPGADGIANLTAALAAARTQAVAAPLARAALTWPYGPAAAGPAPTRATVAHGIVQLAWPNQVRANVLPSTREPGKTLVQLRLLLPPLPQATLATFALQVLVASGTGQLAAEDLAQLLSATSVQSRALSLQDSQCSIQVSCTPGDLTKALEVVLARIQDPILRPDVGERLRTAWLEQFAAMASDPEALADHTLDTLLAAGDVRRRPATREEVAAVSLADASAWLLPLLATAPLAITVTGDLPSEAEAILAAHLGGLPERTAWPVLATLADGFLPAEPPVAAQRRDLSVPGITAKAAIRLTWPTTDHRDVRAVRRLAALADVFGERLRTDLRERLGEAYSPGAYHVASETFAGIGQFRVVASVAPDKAAEAEVVIRAIAQDLHDRGVAEDLLARVLTPRVKSVEAMRQRDSYWLTVADRSHTQPFRLAWASELPTDLAAITVADLNELARTYLDPARAIAVVAVSAGK